MLLMLLIYGMILVHVLPEVMPLRFSKFRKKLPHALKVLCLLVLTTPNLGLFWEELVILCQFPKCICHCIVVQQDYEMNMRNFDQKLITQFLMGLNDSFTASRGQLLMMTPLPTVNKAFSLLVQDEKQRCGTVSNSTLNISEVSTALFSKANHSSTTKRFVKGKGKMFCDHCHGDSYTIENCFFLHGYPDWHMLHGKKPDASKMPKFLKQKNSTSAVHGTSYSGHTSDPTSPNLISPNAFKSSKKHPPPCLLLPDCLALNINRSWP